MLVSCLLYYSLVRKLYGVTIALYRDGATRAFSLPPFFPNSDSLRGKKSFGKAGRPCNVDKRDGGEAEVAVTSDIVGAGGGGGGRGSSGRADHGHGCGWRRGRRRRPQSFGETLPRHGRAVGGSGARVACSADGATVAH